MHDIDEIRRKAMEILEQEVGGPAAAAAQAGMSYSQWANLRSGAPDSKTGRPRGMRKATARKIEAAFGKLEGWLDVADLVDRNYQRHDAELELVVKAWNLADEADRAVPLAWANAILTARSKR